MKIPLRFALLLSLGGCSSSDDGTSCKRSSDTYVGLVDISRSSYPLSSPGPSVGSGGVAVFVPSKDADALPQIPSCGGAAKTGQCCYIAPPPDAGDDSSSGPDLSAWNVTVTDENDPDAGSYSEVDIFADGGSPFPGGGAEPLGSLRIYEWSGGDLLRVESNGMDAVGAFSGQIKSPLELEGLSPRVFWDGGSVPIGADFALSWTPGGASSITIEVLDQTTLGEILCTVADNGAFTIPKSLLANFQSGDQGGFILIRSAGSCAYSDNASISLQAQTLTLVGGAQFQ